MATGQASNKREVTYDGVRESMELDSRQSANACALRDLHVSNTNCCPTDALQTGGYSNQKTKDDVDINEPPPYRGSTKTFRWFLVICSSFVFTVTSITQVSFGIFITEIEHVFGLSHAMIGLIGSFRLSLSLGGGK